MKWENLTSAEFDEAIEKAKGLCIMPIGCLETHGEHLVTGCDGHTANYICNLAAEKEPAVIFPTGFWLGEVIPNHSNDRDMLKEKHLRGYISLNPLTLLTILEELCEEIYRNGFDKILFVSGHGGNSAVLNLLMRSMLYKKRNFAVMCTNVDTIGDANSFYDIISKDKERFNYLSEEDLKTLEHYAQTGFGGGHAHFTEVATNIAQGEEHVRLDKIGSQSGLSNHRMDHFTNNSINFGGSWMANFPNAFSGFDPYGCTPAIGKAFCEILAEKLAEKYKIIKDDEECLKIASRKG